MYVVLTVHFILVVPVYINVEGPEHCSDPVTSCGASVTPVACESLINVVWSNI